MEKVLDITPLLDELDMLEAAVAAARAQAESDAQVLSALRVADSDGVCEWRVAFGAAGGLVAIHEGDNWLQLSDTEIALGIAALWDPAWTRVVEELVDDHAYDDGDDTFLGLLDHDDSLPGCELGDDDGEDEDDVYERYSPAPTRRYSGPVDDYIPFLN